MMSGSPLGKSSTFVRHTHAVEIFRRLQTFYKENDLFDIVLIAGIDNVTAEAHQVVLSAASGYFLKIFRAGPVKELKLNVDGKTLRLLLDYMYTGSIELHSQTVEVILRAAGLYKMETLVKGCCDFMKDQLNPCNCLGTLYIAKQYDYSDLYNKSLAYAYTHFEKVCAEEQFFKLSELQLNEFLSGDNLQVRSQEKLFHSLVAWFEYDESTREDLIYSLLVQHIRFALLQPRFIIENRQRISRIQKCSNLIYSWLEWHLSPESRERQTTELLYAYEDGISLRVQSFSSEFNKWSYKDWPQIPERRTEFGMIVINKKLIIAGGLSCDITTKGIECLDLQTLKWTDLRPMKLARHFPAMAEINGSLYVVGGWIEGSWTNALERYDFATREWVDLPPLIFSVPHVKAVALNGNLYVAGEGRSNLQRYKPTTETWSCTAEKNVKLSNFGIAVVGYLLYAVGGEDDIRCESKTVESYNPLTNKWTVIQSMNVPRSHLSCVAWTGRLLACGGVRNSNQVTNAFEEYNPQINEWRILDPYLCPKTIYMISANLSVIPAKQC